MQDPNQLDVPASFIALYLVAGRLKRSATRDLVTSRYEFCEDLANHLWEYARAQHHDLGVAEDEVLRRCRLGLLTDASVLDEAEADWVVRRLAELTGWDSPDFGV